MVLKCLDEVCVLKGKGIRVKINVGNVVGY